jgi:hypothetical protein
MNKKQFFYHHIIKRNIYSVTGPLRVLPDFLVIGVKRCGTTSLFHNLPKHPSILNSHHDGIGFFNDNYQLGVNWYRSFFPTIFSKNKIIKKYGDCKTFDVTTRYIEDRSTAKKIKEIIPNAKIIVMLRNPVDRAYSQFNVSVKEKVETRSFHDAINEEIENIKKENMKNFEISKNEFDYIKKGMYASQLKPWFDIISKDNIGIFSTEEFKKNNQNIYNMIFKFLGITNCEIKDNKIMEKGDYLPMNYNTRDLLLDFYKKHNEELFKLINKRFDWEN